MGLKERIKTSAGRKEEKVFVEEWGVDILLRELSGKDRAAMVEKFTFTADGAPDIKFEAMLEIYLMLVIAGCYDPETGERVFDETDKEWLFENSGGVLDRVAKQIMKLSGLTQSAQDELGKN